MPRGGGGDDPFLRRRLAAHIAHIKTMVQLNIYLPAYLKPPMDTIWAVVALRGVQGPAAARQAHVCLCCGGQGAWPR